MTHRVVFGALMVLGILLALGVAAQVPDSLEDGIPVRRVSEVGTLEQLQIAVTRALIPGSKVIAPLFAYDPKSLSDLVRENPQQNDEYGPAAIVVDMGSGGIHAFYYSTIKRAIEAIEKDSRFQNSVTDEYHLAITYPLKGGFKETGRFLTRDVERVEARLQLQEEARLQL